MTGYEPSLDMTRLPARYHAAKNSAVGVVDAALPRTISSSRQAARAPLSRKFDPCLSAVGDAAPSGPDSGFGYHVPVILLAVTVAV
jgi:hypothetical protein